MLILLTIQNVWTKKINNACISQPILINLHLSEYTQGLRYYPYSVYLDKCKGSCNTLDDISNKICVSNKTEDLNLEVFNLITGTNESKKLTNIYHTNINVNSMVGNVTQIKIRTTVNVGVSVKIRENIGLVKNIIFGICPQ